MTTLPASPLKPLRCAEIGPPFDTIVDQFLRRKAEPSMIHAIEKTGTSDERVFQKLDKLASEPNPEYEEVPQVARRAKERLEMQGSRRSH
jgi:hypothetical protein